MREDVLPINSPFHKVKDRLLLGSSHSRLNYAHVYLTTSTTTIPSVLQYCKYTTTVPAVSNRRSVSCVARGPASRLPRTPRREYKICEPVEG